MAYGQKNYSEVLGNSQYRISQVGCFLVAFCNLLERFGKGIDPLALNAYFRDNGVYLNIGDGPGVLDGLGWASVTGYASDIRASHVKQNGDPVWPPTNNSIVKFAFNGTTHFCLVADSRAQTIVDSYDGVVRSPGYYGSPVSWATYDTIAPQVVKPTIITAPATPSGETLVLPPVPLWAVYALGTPGRKGTTDQVGSLSPAAFGGLSYAVLGHPMANFVTIETKSFGVVNIYVGQGTGAQIVPSYAPAVPVAASEPPISPPAVFTHHELPVTTPSPPVTTAVAPTPVATDAPVAEDPEAYRQSYSTKEAGAYRAVRVAIVKDLAGDREDVTLPVGTNVSVGGSFTKDGIVYYRTKKSALPENDWWYGIPVDALELVRIDTPVHEQEDDSPFDLDLVAEAKQLLHNLSFRQRLINALASLQAFFVRKKTKS